MRKIVLASSFLISAQALAEETTTARVDQARTLFYQGVEHLRAEQWVLACENLEASNALVETATTHLNLAVCSKHLGRFLAQRDHLKRVLALGQNELSPERLTEAQDALRQLESAIPRIVVHMPTDAQGARVAFGGVVQDGSGPFEVDPGDVRIEVTAFGRAPFRTQVVARESEVTDLDVTLARLVSPTDEQGQQPAPVPTPGALRPSRRPVTTRWWFWAIVGVAVAGGATAAIVLTRPATRTAPVDLPPGTIPFET